MYFAKQVLRRLGGHATLDVRISFENEASRYRFAACQLAQHEWRGH